MTPDTRLDDDCKEGGLLTVLISGTDVGDLIKS